MIIGGDLTDLNKTLMYIMRFWILFGLLLAFCNGIKGEESGKTKNNCVEGLKFNVTL